MPPHIKRVATLPCEICMSENYCVLCAVAILLKDSMECGRPSFTQPPMRRMRMCFTDVFLFCFFSSFFSFFPSATKIPDNRSRERLNGFSWNFYQTIAGKINFASPYPMGLGPRLIILGLKTTHCALGGDAWRMTQKNYFMLVCWLWHCAATAVALQMHEGVNAINLVGVQCHAINTSCGYNGVQKNSVDPHFPHTKVRFYWIFHFSFNVDWPVTTASES